MKPISRDCPCIQGMGPDMRGPSSLQEVREAFLDGEAVHDDDGDCVVVMYDKDNLDAAARRKVKEYNHLSGAWYEEYIAYKVAVDPNETYFREYHLMYVPENYEMGKPVTPEEEQAAIASILGSSS